MTKNTINDQITRDNNQLSTNNQDTITKPEQRTKRGFDLEKRTTDYAKAVIRFCRGLPRNPINDRLVHQVIGSSGSIGANYREANDALGKKDFIQHLKISRREAKESLHWLECLTEANQSKINEILLLKKEADELKKILSAIIGKVSAPLT